MPPRRIAPLRDEITIRVDGEDVAAERGEPIAVALAASGRLVLGRSVKYHRPRGAACYAGRCDGCLMRVGGEPSRMTCRVPCAPGTDVETQNVLGSAGVDLLAATDWFFPHGMNHHEMFTWSKPVNRVMQTVARRVAGVGTLPEEPRPPVEPVDRRCDLLVIGAGPSGLACAAEAARAGIATLVVDEEDAPGGHLAWSPGAPRARGSSLAEAARAAGAELLLAHAVLAIYEPGPGGITAIADGPEQLVRIAARRVVIAQGRHEGAWAFEGNDLPGILGSEAAARLLARGVLCGERVLLAGPTGDGPGAAALAALSGALAEKGAKVVGPIDRARLVRARGRTHVTACDVRAAAGDDVEKIACDALVVAPPSSAVYELAEQAGVEVAWSGASFELVASEADGSTRAPWARVVGRAAGVHDLDRQIAQATAAARAIAGEVARG